ncbi:MAG: hypothetical protein ACOCRK_01275 [bacterium]
MENQLDVTDIINSINKILQEFIQTQWDENDLLYDVYCSFDYEEVQNAFENINNNKIDNKPVIHLWENPINNDKKTKFHTGNKGERLLCSYDIFIVINENFESSKKRKILLNELASKLKYKFDNYSYQMNMFKDVNINVSNGILNENSNNLYAIQQQLSFEIYKELK